MISKPQLKNISREKLVFFLIMILFGPVAFWARFYFWSNALLEPHPWRQTQTALTIVQLVKGTGSVWDYRSPLAGMLWNNVYEFPLYQWFVSRFVLLGMSLDVSSRLVTVVSFFLSAIWGSLILRDLFNQKIANWFLLLYLVNPFGVIFSRVCLIDFFALSATLASLYGAMRIRSGHDRWWHWVSFFIGGLIAGLTKINIWFFPVFAFFGYVFLGGINKKGFKARGKWRFCGVLCFQVLLIFLWNYHRVTALHSPADTPWLIGEFHQRFELWRWKKILWQFGARSLFFDFLVIPFLFGNTVLFRQVPKLFFVVWGIFIAHTLIFFQVQTYHDYYLIATMPYLYGVVAVGMDYLCRNSNRVSTAGLIATLFLMIFKLTKLPVYFSPIYHDYRPELAQVYELKKHTAPEDLIYWDAKQGRFEIATYSERRVGLYETLGSIGKTSENNEIYRPTVFHFDSTQIPMEIFKPYAQVWIDGTKMFKLYRTDSAGKVPFEPEKHLGVTSLMGDGSSGMRRFRKNINNCEFPVPVLVPVPKGAREIRVTGGDFVVTFPGDKLFLNIPNSPEWACNVKIEIIP